MQTDTYALPHVEVARRSFVVKVYAWMALALTLTALVAMTVASYEGLIGVILTNRILFFVLIIAQLGLVILLSARIDKMSAATATFVFFAYAALTGVTFSVLFAIYTAASIASTFFVTAGTFGVMSAYGYFTRRDLTSWGNLLFMGLIGIIIASVVNFFLQNQTVYWVVTFLGVLIFVGLTAYDTQKIKNMGAEVSIESEEGRKRAVMGSLALYLDFINLFLMLLRLMGRRR
ncbi:MAG: Bax inhibitor-1/YccA family protein [candidate division Zixibacteria bacterium]|nr:Bax inhibitor-1/YccA family protein [candidate division Zixibacteria bacterium]